MCLERFVTYVVGAYPIPSNSADQFMDLTLLHGIRDSGQPDPSQCKLLRISIGPRHSHCDAETSKNYRAGSGASRDTARGGSPEGLLLSAGPARLPGPAEAEWGARGSSFPGLLLDGKPRPLALRAG